MLARGEKQITSASEAVKRASAQTRADFATFNGRLPREEPRLGRSLAREQALLQAHLGVLNQLRDLSGSSGRATAAKAVDVVRENAAQAKATFDSIEDQLTGFAQSVKAVLGSDNFRIMERVQKAQRTVAGISRDNTEFVRWLSEHEAETVPWMREVSVQLG